MEASVSPSAFPSGPDSGVRAHYDELLGEHYVWMATGGDYGTGVRDSIAMLSSFNLSTANGSALDLGSGPGIQAAALAQLGYSRIAAVDNCARLVDQMRRANTELVKGGRLSPIEGDLLDAGLVRHLAPFDLILCIGDTPTHLPDVKAVEQLAANANELLAPKGRLLLRFRDLTPTLVGPDRFISVRSDANRIMTCFLEDAGPERIGVTDLIYQRDGDTGTWHLRKSSYHKLRLSPAGVRAHLRAHSFQIEEERNERGLISLLASRVS